MSNKVYTCSALVLCALSLLLSSGCAAFRISTSDVNLDKPGSHLDADYDYMDMRKITESIADEMMASAFLQSDEKPIMMVAGIENRTTRHADMKNLSDRIRTLLIQRGGVPFINAARRDDLLREQGYQTANATPETSAAVGQQLGAKYMITGSLTEMRNTSGRQVRVSKKEVNYYKLTVEVTDLTTGLISWTTDKEFAREASRPLIGW